VCEVQYKPTFTFNKETGTYEINSLEEVPIGITLEVTPHVNYNGDVTLDIIPEVSALSGYQTFNDIQIPITNVRKIDTRVSLKDMHTVAIGGLIKDDWTTLEHSVPFLGDMPYLGPSCFSWHSKEKRTVNLVIFITPTVLKTQQTDKRWQPQLDDMHLTADGDWHDVITNYPSAQLMQMRERLLIGGMTNTAAAAGAGPAQP
jgi:type II secretory pathway component GspD/PulD (secretin)